MDTNRENFVPAGPAAVTLSAHAKINLVLDVVRRREDGYHELRMVNQKLELADAVTLEKIPEGIELSCSDPSLPCGPENLAWRAAEAFFARFGISGGVKIRLEKRIPAGAGLAGGSSDAAAVLRGLGRLYPAENGADLFAREGAGAPVAYPSWMWRLGADIPFCFAGCSAALTEGIGEKITALPGLAHGCIVMAKPEISISTRAVFEAVDAQEDPVHPDADAAAEALRCGDAAGVCAHFGNSLAAVTKAWVPEVARLEEILMRCGALGAQMSGSGPTVFGVFENEADAQRALEAVRESGLAPFACVTRPVRH
ncbi:MAG: 4-(cytidine 5'-diphospho)-2-C-methyl-D-erythritol kinase [Lachnospiraceae bacterium]|nr:4-(cytidine 5'-diphospho)-2-C-methyl-D-erythritol kinase [Lachnospiraceae bacterium]